MFLSGDGNFHLHRRDNHAGTGNIAAILKARSMIGDAGFWAPQAKFDTYINATSAIPEARSGVRDLSTWCEGIRTNPVFVIPDVGVQYYGR